MFLEKDIEVKYTLPKPGEGIYIVAYINSQTIDEPAIHELVSNTLTRNIGEISIGHDNYNRPNGYVFIRVFEHSPVKQLEMDRFRASTFNGAPIKARLFENEDEFKKYMDLFSSSLLKKIPLEPPTSQLQLISNQTQFKYKPTYHHIFISEIDDDKFRIKSLIAEYAPIKKVKFFSVTGKNYADFYFLKVDDVRNIYALYKEGKVKLNQAKMYAFYGTVHSRFLLLNNTNISSSSHQLIEEFGSVVNKQYIESTKQLIVEMEKTSAAGRAACILKNEMNFSIYTIHEGYFKQLLNKYSIKEEKSSKKKK